MQPVSGLEVEVMLFVQAILAGAGLFLVYDVLRVIRRIFVHGIIWVSIEDALYWMISGFWIFLRICRMNDGIIRGYMLVAGLAGLCSFQQTFDVPHNKNHSFCKKAIEKNEKCGYNKKR